MLFHKVIRLLIAIVVLSGNTIAQQAKVKLQVTLQSTGAKKIYLHSFYGHNIITIDSVVLKKSKSTSKAEFTFTFAKGFYRLTTGKIGEEFDVLVENNGTITLQFDKGTDYPNFLNSSSVLIQDYVKLQLFTRKCNELIGSYMKIARSTSSEDSMHVFSEKKDSVIHLYKTYLKDIRKRNEKNLLGRSTYFLLEPEFEASTAIEKRNYLSEHFFDLMPLDEPAFIRSTLLPNVIARYYERYVDYDEPGFKKSIEVILKNASRDPQVYEFTLNFLMNLFNNAGPQIIFDHLIENYWKENACAENDLPQITELMKLQPGNVFPDTTIFVSNQLQSITNISKKHNLMVLVFWSAHCPHCIDELKTLQALKKSQGNKLGVLAIHIDRDTNGLNQICENYKSDFIFSSENKGWEGPLVKKLRVVKTPTVYLLEGDRISARNIYKDDLKKIISSKLN